MKRYLGPVEMFSFIAVFILIASVAMGQGLPELEASERAPMLNMLNDSPPNIEDQAVYPVKPYNDESVTVSARVYSDPTKASMPVAKVMFWYKFDGGEWMTMEMLNTFDVPDRYFATVTPPAGAKKMIYRIVARDVVGNVGVVLSAADSVDITRESDFLWVEDRDEEDEVVPKDIDFLALGVARDADNLYVVEKTEGKPGPGNMATTGANLYLAPFFPPGKGLASFLGGEGNILAYAPMAAAMFGIPKSGFFSMKDLVAAFTDKKPIPKSDVDLKLESDRLIFTLPLKELGAGDEWVTGVVALKFNPGAGQPAPWETTPFLRIVLKGGVVDLRDGKSRAPAPIQAGASTFDITPPVGTPFCGYGDRVGTPSEGVHDKLMGSALIIESDNRYYCIIGMDLFYMRINVFRDITRRVRDATGLPEQCFFMGASHSHHASGALIPDLALLGGPYDPEVYESTVKKIVDGIVAAYKDMKPAAMGVGWTTMQEGKFVTGNRRSGDNARDTIIGVIKVDGTDGKPIATIFNMSAHPTSLSSKTMLFSSDFVGPARDAVTRAGGGIGLFMNGSLGDHSAQCPGDCSGDEFEVAKMKGEALAQYVMEVRNKIQARPEIKLRGATQWLLLNRSTMALTMERALVVNDKFLFLSIPGETFFDPIGMNLRKLARDHGFEQFFVFGITNDGLGYIYPEEIYYQHVYESSYSVYGPKMNPFLEENARSLINILAGK